MSRKNILDEVEQEFGLVPGWMNDMPDSVLEQYWNTTKWILEDSKLPARDKALVAFGAAAAIHCPY